MKYKDIKIVEGADAVRTLCRAIQRATERSRRTGNSRFVTLAIDAAERHIAQYPEDGPGIRACIAGSGGTGTIPGRGQGGTPGDGLGNGITGPGPGRGQDGPGRGQGDGIGQRQGDEVGSGDDGRDAETQGLVDRVEGLIRDGEFEQARRIIQNNPDVAEAIPDSLEDTLDQLITAQEERREAQRRAEAAEREAERQAELRRQAEEDRLESEAELRREAEEAAEAAAAAARLEAEERAREEQARRDAEAARQAQEEREAARLRREAEAAQEAAEEAARQREQQQQRLDDIQEELPDEVFPGGWDGPTTAIPPARPSQPRTDAPATVSTEPAERPPEDTAGSREDDREIITLPWEE